MPLAVVDLTVGMVVVVPDVIEWLMWQWDSEHIVINAQVVPSHVTIVD